MDDAEFGRRARVLMERRGMGVRALAKRINYDAGFVSKVLNGHKSVPARLAEAADIALGAGGELVRTASPSEPPVASDQSVISKIATEIREHAEAAEVSEVGRNALEQFRADIANLARSYLATPPLPLFAEMIYVRDRLTGALARRSHPDQTKELYLLAGAVCALMANASLDLGHLGSSDDLARSAWTYGRISAHGGLMGWARGTQALTAILDGRPEDAVQYANQGLAVTSAGTGKARLYSVAARALACESGDHERAREAIQDARNERDKPRHDDLPDSIRGEFAFDGAKQFYYEAVTFVLLKDPRKAEPAACAAIELFESRKPRQRSYGCEALARVQLALARLMSGELEGANEALQPIFTLSPEQRISSLTQYLAASRNLLLDTRYRGSRQANELDELIQLFCISAIHVDGVA